MEEMCTSTRMHTRWVGMVPPGVSAMTSINTKGHPQSQHGIGVRSLQEMGTKDCSITTKALQA